MTEQTVVSVLLVALSWVFSGLVTYGYMKAKLLDFERRLEAQETESKEFITRQEYDARHGDLIRQLDRIEAKIDRYAIR